MFTIVTTTIKPGLSHVTRTEYRCEPVQYRRHIEAHIEKIYKYLHDRKERRNEERRKYLTNQCQNESMIEEINAKKESQYLRSLRIPLTMADFKCVAEIGDGYFGRVYLVEKKSPQPGCPILYAMKKVDKSKMKMNHTSHQALVKAERDMLAEADNEWIIKLYYSFQDSSYLYFIMEYAPGGDLMNYLIEVGRFNEKVASFYIAEISLAVQFVHDQGYIHRDIKPDNILIDAEGHVKLADFGLCTSRRPTHSSRYYLDDNFFPGQDDHPTITTQMACRELNYPNQKRNLSLVGSQHYMAPEVVQQACDNNSGYDQLCDWWSVGVILYEMLVGYAPFIDLVQLENNNYNPQLDPPEMIQRRILDWKSFLKIPQEREISKDAKDLILGLLRDANSRLCKNGIQDLRPLPFFRDIDWINIRAMKAPFRDQVQENRLSRQLGYTLAFQNSNTLGNSVGLPIEGFTHRCFP